MGGDDDILTLVCGWKLEGDGVCGWKLEVLGVHGGIHGDYQVRTFT